MKIAIWGYLETDIRREGGPEAVIRRCRDAGIDQYLAFPHKANDADTLDHTYPSTLQEGRTGDLLAPFARAARQEGLRVEPWWIPAHVRRKTDSDANRAAWAYRSPMPEGNKKHGNTPCMTWPEVRAAAIEHLHDLINKGGQDLTGIHMDVIRYADNPTSLSQPCQCDACRREYRRRLGLNAVTAEDLKDPGALHLFLAFRGAMIRSLVEQAQDITQRAGLRLSLAARALFFNDALVEGQDWAAWARDGLVDAVYTMNYFVDRQRHTRHLHHHVRLLSEAPTVEHRDGIGRKSSFGELATPEALIAHIDDVREAGVEGVSIFHYNGMTDADFAALKQIHT